MSNKKTYSIKCTSCNAPLNILGGGRINSVTCEYCNSVLDMNNEYKVLSQFENISRPNTPFKLGMVGVINDIEWTIIACVSYKTDDYEDNIWSELSLYSPLYGYAWLVYEDGKLAFSKRVRDFDLLSWELKNKPKTIFYNKTHYILAEEEYNSYIDFVEGELSWIAKKGDKIRCWDYIGLKKNVVTIEKIDKEIEVYKTDKIDARKVYESFGIDKEIIDDITPKDIKFSPQTKLSFTIIFLFMVYAFFSSYTVYYHTKSSVDYNRILNITSDRFLTHIEIKASSYRLLKKLKIDIINTKSKDVELTYRDNNVTFQHKLLSGMEKGYKNQIDIYVKLPKGKYIISPKNSKNISITIEQSYVRMIYISTMIALYILYMIIFLIVEYKKQNFIYYTLAFVIGSLSIGFLPTIILLIIFKVYTSKKAKK